MRYKLNNTKEPENLFIKIGEKFIKVEKIEKHVRPTKYGSNTLRIFYKPEE